MRWKERKVITMVALKKKIEPELCTYLDDSHTTITIEIVLPGVPRDNIKLRVNSRCLLLVAISDDADYTTYVPFIYPVRANRAQANFEHGLLRVHVPLRA
ncbi:Hsp20/alpha crystallin family protein [candidate division WOR-3 bacterium]|nr:Hsp20/alpha crystallin family protein [candidate division WOR-3 bacterium]